MCEFLKTDPQKPGIQQPVYSHPLPSEKHRRRGPFSDFFPEEMGAAVLGLAIKHDSLFHRFIFGKERNIISLVPRRPLFRQIWTLRDVTESD